MILGPCLPRNAVLYPDKPAIIVPGGRSLTHAELNERVRRLGGGMASLGLCSGRSIGIVARSSAEYLEVYFAAGLVGALLVPVNLHLNPADMSSRLRHAQCEALVFDAEFAGTVAALDSDVRAALQGRMWCIGSDPGRAHPYESLITAGPFLHEPPEVKPEDILYLGYTSGTTGPSKGAQISQRAVVVGYLYKAVAYALGKDDVSYNPGPFWHSAPRDYASLAIYLGGTCVVTRGFDPAQYLALVEQHRVTNSFLVPTMLQMLMERADLERYDVRSLRVLLSGGSPLPPPLKARVLAHFGDALHEFYGATETRMITSIGAPEMRARPKSVGRAFPDVEIQVKAEQGGAVAVGEIGEVFVKGPGVFSGYFKDPGKTAESFRDGWFTLGDMGRLDEAGYLYLVDRKQDMIISGGENVYPNDIEDTLLAAPGVKEVAVIGLPDPKWGECITAVVVGHPGGVPSQADLERACADLPAYMRPRRFEYQDALPRSANGKILRRVLREQFAQHAVLT